MATITAAEVNKLRKHTGAGMMDCKKALVEAEGDFDKAIEILRKKGQKVAEKRGDRDANEGVIMAGTSGNFAALISLNCETDFVAQNADFIAVANRILNVALAEKPGSVEDLRGMKFNDELTISEKILEEIGKIGEKIDLSEYETVSAANVIAYNHPGNKTATIVALNLKSDEADQAGKNVAMQIAAMAPVALDENSVSEEIKARELEIGRELAIKEGKPEAILDKIAEGKLQKYYKDNTLLNQQYFVDNKLSVSQYLKSVNKELTVTDFKRSSLV
ncbi:MAG: elongation factor Ts [Bacteroidetes bacterium]|nr:MAG: elongation factor Ts [Bacteroidota bacterium]MBL1144821.1 elongation factor Ts [Bacteroidota bacterium]MCB0802766.1 elongation factor Ts [Flavobacteriales bacterium]NOG57615.1 elongation factor Ts [Bacteroidota bacterium]